MIFMIDSSVLEMYFLTKLCRLCVQTKQSLVNLDAEDYDSVSFSKKLEICTKMVIKPQKEVSKEICSSCVNKLRISYEFYNMCKKSTGILNGYVSKLLSGSTDINSNIEAFPNTNIYVALTKSPASPRKRRIGKSERCAAIQKLLSHKQHEYLSCNNEMCLLTARTDKPRGGLKDLLSFTKSFDFGYSTSGPEIGGGESPLDKLIEFSESFFYEDFEEYRNSILCVIESKRLSEDVDEYSSDDSDIDEMFKSCDEDEDDPLKFEEILLPDCKIKQEFADETESENTHPLNYLQICYNQDDVKNEECEMTLNNNNNENLAPCKEIDGEVNRNCGVLTNNYIFNTSLQKRLDQENQQELTILSKLTESIKGSSDFLPKRAKLISEPYIHPKLQRQYLLCNFKCDTCNRNFKSHGYLKAHNSKVHNTYK